MVKIVEEEQKSPGSNPGALTSDCVITLKIIDELWSIAKDECPKYTILGRINIDTAKLAEPGINLLKRWVKENPSRLKKILDRIENHLSHRGREAQYVSKEKRKVKKP